MTKQQVANLMLKDMPWDGAEIAAPLTLPGALLAPSYVEQTAIATPANPAAGKVRLYPKADGKYYTLTSAGVEAVLGTGVTLPLTQNLTFSPDNTLDVGAAGVTRPRTVYAGTSVITPSVTTPQVVTSGAVDLNFGTNAVNRWTVTSAGHYYPTLDNTYDIGWTTLRPRTLYVGTSFYLGSFIEQTTITKPANPAAGNLRWYPKADGLFYRLDSSGVESSMQGPPGPQGTQGIQGIQGPPGTSGSAANIAPWNVTTGHLTVIPDNTYDIGAAGVTRPRDINLGRNLIIAGQIQGPANITYSHAANTGTGFGSVNPASHTATWVNGATVMRFETGAHRIGSAIGLGWSSSTDANTAGNDTILWRGAAGVIDQRNGINAQQFRIYNTTDAPITNYERIGLAWFSNRAELSTWAGGTGVARAMCMGTRVNASVQFMVNSIDVWAFSSAGNGTLVANTDNTLDIGFTGANRPRDLNLGRNLVLNTSSRILGDFSNVTHASRVMLQTSIANSSTVVGVMPSGTGTFGQINLYAGSDPDNSTMAQLFATTTEVSLRSGATGTGTYQPLTMWAVNGERIRITQSGTTTGAVVQIGASANERIRNPQFSISNISVESSDGYAFMSAGLNSHLGSNAYWDGANWNRFNVANPGSYLGVQATVFTWGTTAAGANPAVFTQRFSVDNTGNLTVGGIVSAGTLTSSGAVNGASLVVSGAGSIGTTLTVTGASTINNTLQISAADAGVLSAGTGSFGLMIQPTGGGASKITYHRPGVFAAYMGLDTDNYFKVGGWSMGASSWRIIHEGLASPTLLDPKLAAAIGFLTNANDLTNYMFFYGTGTVTLPAAGGRAGQVRFIKAWGGGVTVNSAGTNLMPPGSIGVIVSSFAMVYGDSVTMVCDGSYWWTV